MSVCSKLKGPCPCSRSFGLSLRVDMPEKKRVKFIMGWTSILPYWHTIEGEEGFCFISRITDLAMRHHLPCGIDFVNKLVRKFNFVIPLGIARKAHYFITDRSKLRPMLWVITYKCAERFVYWYSFSLSHSFGARISYTYKADQKVE